MEDVLNDALEQSSSIFKTNDVHVDQDDLDSLISQELTKREAETEELNKKNREKSLNIEESERDNSIEDSTINASISVEESSIPNEATSNIDESAVNESISAQESSVLNETISNTGESDISESVVVEENSILNEEETSNIDESIVSKSSIYEEDNVLDEATPIPNETTINEQVVSESVLDDTASDTKESIESVKDPIDEATLNTENTESKGEETSISVKELKVIASKIISGGDSENIDINIKGEIGELLKLILETKSRVDEIDPALQVSHETIPVVTSALKDVNTTTEKATLDLIETSERMSAFYKELINDIDKLKDYAMNKDEKGFFELYGKTSSSLSEAVDLGFEILEALEFQDITEQKLRKVMKSIEDMGSRIGTIVGFLQINKPNTNNKQINNLLIDYGLV